VDAIEAFRPRETVLAARMREKAALEAAIERARLLLQRRRLGYGPPVADGEAELETRIQTLRTELLELDAQIAPLARESGAVSHPRWGLLTRAGNDKSHLARQIERYADVYTSRVSNFLATTPFAYLRAPRGSLPHDP